MCTQHDSDRTGMLQFHNTSGPKAEHTHKCSVTLLYSSSPSQQTRFYVLVCFFWHIVRRSLMFVFSHRPSRLFQTLVKQRQLTEVQTLLMGYVSQSCFLPQDCTTGKTSVNEHRHADTFTPTHFRGSPHKCQRS